MSEAKDHPEVIAVVGAGIAGLTAARELARAGASVRVFDKGRGVGGRTSTRHANEARRFDHGAQYFTANSERFAAQTAAWVEAGVAAPWAGKLVTVECGTSGCRFGDPPGAKTRYVGTPGMNALAKSLAEEVVAAGGSITTGVRVSPLKRADGAWRLAGESGETLGDFAKVLVTTPAPQAAELLTASPSLSNAAKSVRMTGCWTVMAAFAERVAIEADGAFVNGPAEATPLSWIARNGSKPGRPTEAEADDCWVLDGSPAWSEANLDIDANTAIERLLAAFWEATGQPPREPSYAAAHRWRYALSENPLEESCLADTGLRLYAAGDWCGGPKIEGAFLSGLAAARAMGSE